MLNVFASKKKKRWNKSMETSVLMGIISAVLIAVVNVLAYQLGKRNVEKTNADKLIQSVSAANKVRSTLRDNTVLDELHNEFKR